MPSDNSGWKRLAAVVSRIDMNRDHAFSLFLLSSFVAILLLGLLGRAAEMAVLAGFSAICMVFLKLELFSEFSGVGFSAKLKKVEETVQALAVKETEVDPDEEDVASAVGMPTVLQVSPKEKEVLAVIEAGRFTYRTLAGVAQELGISRRLAEQHLESLVEKGFVASAVTSRRTRVWNITEAGKAYLARAA